MKEAITWQKQKQKQVKSLGSFINYINSHWNWGHDSIILNLFICCTLYVYVLLTIQCSHWPWLGWKLCLIKLFTNFVIFVSMDRETECHSRYFCMDNIIFIFLFQVKIGLFDADLYICVYIRTMWFWYFYCL